MAWGRTGFREAWLLCPVAWCPSWGSLPLGAHCQGPLGGRGSWSEAAPGQGPPPAGPWGEAGLRGQQNREQQVWGARRPSWVPALAGRPAWASLSMPAVARVPVARNSSRRGRDAPSCRPGLVPRDALQPHPCGQRLCQAAILSHTPLGGSPPCTGGRGPETFLADTAQESSGHLPHRPRGTEDEVSPEAQTGRPSGPASGLRMLPEHGWATLIVTPSWDREETGLGTGHLSRACPHPCLQSPQPGLPASATSRPLPHTHLEPPHTHTHTAPRPSACTQKPPCIQTDPAPSPPAGRPSTPSPSVLSSPAPRHPVPTPPCS